MKYHVVFSPEAEEQLAGLYRYIAAAASPGIAERYLNAIISYCETLETFPLRGAQRDDLRPGLRITHYNAYSTPIPPPIPVQTQPVNPVETRRPVQSKPCQSIHSKVGHSVHNKPATQAG